VGRSVHEEGRPEAPIGFTLCYGSRNTLKQTHG
jgi:hypothetical protein